MENRNDKKRLAFKKLAQSRTNKALDNMKLILNLANTSNYDFEEEDVKKILKALSDGIKSIENRFAEPLQKRSKPFKL